MGTVNSILLGLGLLLLGGCSSPVSTPVHKAKATASHESSAELVMKPIRVESYGVDGLEWALEAPIAEGYSQKNIMLVNDMKVSLFDKGQPSSTIQAKEAFISAKMTKKDGIAVERTQFRNVTLDPGDMFLRGDVVVVSTDGTKIMTDWAEFDKSSELITSSAPVKVIREDSITEGVGLRATSNLAQVEIFNQTLIIKGNDEL